MKLRSVVTNLIAAQNSQDTRAYAACFTEAAIVHDEGKIHTGKTAIRTWNEESNRQYQTFLKPIGYRETANGQLLRAKVSGNFPGSPAILQFQLSLEDGLISSLNISG